MKRVYVFVCAAILASSPAISADNIYRAKPIRVAATCFSTGEQVSGMNKICYYDCLGSAVAITVRSIDLCPLSINR